MNEIELYVSKLKEKIATLHNAKVQVIKLSIPDEDNLRIDILEPKRDKPLYLYSKEVTDIQEEANQ